jgi:hypothetical protein
MQTELVDEALAVGAQSASDVARSIMAQTREAMGFE